MNTKATARRLAQESIVLLKNDNHLLPFQNRKTVAFFGRAQNQLIFSGNGSGASKAESCKNIVETCEQKKIYGEEKLKLFYREMSGKEPEETGDTFDWTKVSGTANCGLMYEIFGQYHAPKEEYAVPDGLVRDAAGQTDTAVWVIGRNSGGEECDRYLYEDYYLTDSERALAGQICDNFENVVLILNVNGLIDLAWTKEYKNIRSILFLGIPGEEGAAALAEILAGNINPSGKLPVTIAEKYEDYPSAEHFSWDKDHPEQILDYRDYGLSAKENGSTGFEKSPVTVYQEDIYAGYRYFDSFHIEPLFPFGYGLSYTDFELRPLGAGKCREGVFVEILVKNAGGAAGKEVVQVYLTGCTGKHRRAYQELKGFEKTRLLAPGESEKTRVLIPWKEFACYEEETASYVIEQGTYLLRAGNSSRDTQPVVTLKIEKNFTVEKCTNRLCLKACNQGKIDFLSTDERWELLQTDRTIEIKEEDFADLIVNRHCDTEDRAANNRTMNKGTNGDMAAELAKSLSMEQLAALCVGYGPGIPFAAFMGGDNPETIMDEKGCPVTTNSHPAGFNGYVSPAITSKGIYSVFYKDGPAGIGDITWPTQMLIACSFDRKLWYEWGNAVGQECEKQKVDFWLAPAVNLHRNPLGGRNFEYFSEDPFLTGICACEVAKGVQENHAVRVCPKHFALNEQETYRRGNAKKNYDAADSIVQERAARELYLKPFEMLVKDGDVRCIMTSFNKINGVLAGGNQDLCTHILREEWNFKGYVVTDWGDMDTVVDGADALAAGNDVVMPGGPPVIRQILKGVEEERITREQMETCVTHLLETVMQKTV